MDISNILSHVDHTVLTAQATLDEILAACDDAIYYKTACLCIPQRFVPAAVAHAKGRLPIGTVAGFPSGYQASEVKAFEARWAVENGASEVDMVINIGYLKDGKDDLALADIAAVRKACEGKILKVICEMCLLTQEEKIRACQIVSASGADYIKTSTGFSTGGATFDDVALMVANTAPHVRVKAAGGISTLEDAEKFLELGATRLGTSRIIKILKSQK